MGALASEDTDVAVRHFTEMWHAVLMVVAVDEAIIGRAMDLAMRHGLRGYDAIQLACAADLAESAEKAGDTVTLWSSDSELLAAARAEKLGTVDPADQRA